LPAIHNQEKEEASRNHALCQKGAVNKERNASKQKLRYLSRSLSIWGSKGKGEGLKKDSFFTKLRKKRTSGKGPVTRYESRGNNASGGP